MDVLLDSCDEAKVTFPIHQTFSRIVFFRIKIFVPDTVVLYHPHSMFLS
jgi:hypothetical protein